jgi:uncharacterized protein
VIVILLLTGVVVGFISSFFGVGGGIVTVPVLFSLFPVLPPQVVIACSLGVIMINSALITYQYVKAGKKLDKRIVIPLAIFMMLGVVIGGKLGIILPAQTIKKVFALILVAVALKMIFSKTQMQNKNDWEVIFNRKFHILMAVTSLLGGFISGLTGLGGGAILVPLFIILLKMPLGWVPLYSNAGMALGTMAGVVTYMLYSPIEMIFSESSLRFFQVGHVNWGIIAIIVAGAHISTKWGIQASQKISSSLANRLFAAMLLTLAMTIFMRN